MLVFLDTTGAVTATAPSTTGRNSAAMSTIYIVAPISGAAVLSLSFRLPNGDEVNPTLADTVHNAVEILAGVPLPGSVRVWSYAIPASVTRIAGTVTYTITTHTESMTGTGSGTFVVTPATTKTLPSSAPTTEVWGDILAELSRIYTALNDTLGNTPVTKLDGETLITVTALLADLGKLIGNTPVKMADGTASTISAVLAAIGADVKHLGEEVQKKLDKTSGTSTIYANDENGAPTAIRYATEVTADGSGNMASIPVRDEGGRIKTAAPVGDDDAVNNGTLNAIINAIVDGIRALEDAVKDVPKNADVVRLEKLMQNLLANIPTEYFVTDSADSYTKQIPATALPWAELQEVGGMSYSVGNLFDAEHVENQFGGAKENIVVENGGAKITITGDPDGSYNSVNLKFEAGVTYCATFGGNGKLYYVPAPAALTEIKSGVPFTPPTSTYYDINCLAFGPDGGTYTDLMIVIGDKPAQYMPYGQNTLKNAAVTALETVGTNRLDISGMLNECLRDNGDGTYTMTKVSNDGRFTEKVPLFAPVGQQLYNTFEVVYTNIPNFGGKLPLQMLDASGKNEVSSVAIVYGDGGWYTAGGGSVYVRIYFEASYPIGSYVTFRKPMVQFAEYYKAPLAPYAPYRKNTINIPAEVQALEGYGQGNPTGTEYNYVDFARRVFVQKGYRDANGAWIATGREIDISAYLPEDNLIEVEGNGSITFVNAENLPVPSKIEYQLKEATA